MSPPLIQRVLMAVPTGQTLIALAELVVEAEKRLAAGCWDEWDHKVLVAWREEAWATFRQAVRHL